MKIKSLLCCFILLISCQSAPENSTSKNFTSEFTNLKDCFKQFAIGITTNNLPLLKEFIAPGFGLFVIESPGALPEMQHVTDFKTWKSFVNGKGILDYDFKNLMLKVINDTLPVKNCDNPPEFYSKSGCFAQKVNRFKESSIWIHSGLSFEKKALAEKMAGMVEWTLVYTTGSCIFYFGAVDEKLKLLFLDLRKPCEA